MSYKFLCLYYDNNEDLSYKILCLYYDNNDDLIDETKEESSFIVNRITKDSVISESDLRSYMFKETGNVHTTLNQYIYIYTSYFRNIW